MAKQNADDLGLNKLYTERLKILAEIKKIKEEEIQLIQQGKKLSDTQATKLKENLSNIKKYNDLIKETNSELKTNIAYYETAESSISGMSSLIGGLKNNLSSISKAGLSFANSLQDAGSYNKEIYTQASEAAAGALEAVASLSQLNAEDTAQIAAKKAEYQSYFNDLSSQIRDLEEQQQDGRTKQGRAVKAQIAALKSIGSEIQSNFADAAQFANVSKDTKGIYEELMGDLEGIEKTFKKIAITTQVFFSSFKNAAGVALFFVGGLVDDFNELAKGIGGTVTQMFQLKAQSFAVSKLLGDEAGSAVTSLAEKLGNANDVTLGMSISVGTLTNRLGVSGEEAAQLVNQFGNLSGKSNEFAMNAMEATSQLASANGVAPSKVMSDIAQNTEFFALYAKDGGTNIGQAAIEARRLGVDLTTAAKISDNLLDYQTSVASEMEASVLLGRNLNLSKARELAYAGDQAGAMKEALNAAGGIAEFNKMDVFQKKAVAEALGTSVSELQQMSANMEKAATPAGKLEESFNSTTAFVQELGAGITGTAVKGIGGMLIGMKDFKGQVADAKEGFTFLKDSAKAIFGAFSGNKLKGFKDITDSAETSAIKNLGKSESITPATPKRGRTPKVKSIAPATPPVTTPPPAPPSAGPQQSMLSKFGSAGQIAAMALVLIAFAAAIYILSQAFAEFDKLQNVGQTLGVFTAAIVGMGLTIGVLASVLAPLQPIILPLVGAMLAFGGAIALVGMGINLAATGMATLVKSFSSLETGQLIAATVGVVGLSAAFYGLASSLVAVGAASTLALPGLAALAIGGLVGGVAGGLIGGGENDGLGDKIDALTTAIMAQPIILTLDGNVIAKTVRKETSKSNIPK